jgi:hypothetical protein
MRTQAWRPAAATRQGIEAWLRRRRPTLVALHQPAPRAHGDHQPHKHTLPTCCNAVHSMVAAARARAGCVVGVPAGLGYLKDNCPSGLGQSVGHRSCTPAAQPARCRTMYECIHAIASRYSAWWLRRARGLAAWWASQPAWDTLRTIVPAAWDSRSVTQVAPQPRSRRAAAPCTSAYMLLHHDAVVWWWRARGLAAWWASQAGLGYPKDNCPSGLGWPNSHV